MATEQVIDKLNSLLRGEISAAETYQQALDKVKDAKTRMELEECYDAHQKRIEKLRGYIQGIGGKPSEGGGPWARFTNLVQAGASLLGDKAAISALEEGEDIGLRDYRDLGELDPDTLRFVSEEILPGQEQTHARLSSLKQRLS